MERTPYIATRNTPASKTYTQPTYRDHPAAAVPLTGEFTLTVDEALYILKVAAQARHHHFDWVKLMDARIVWIGYDPKEGGGFTERRYSPVDVLELLALGDLRRQGFTPAVLKQMMDTLRDYFRRRLSEALDEAGEVRLLTDGRGLFLKTRQGHVFDLLADPTHPLVTGDGLPLKPVTPRARARRKVSRGR